VQNAQLLRVKDGGAYGVLTQFNSILDFNVLYQEPKGQLQIQHKQTK
jgi:hypothetical protein